MPLFDIDLDIRRALTLPSEFYTDEDYFERSKERIFSRTWQLVAGPDLNDGLTPFLLLPGVLNEPLLLSKQNKKIQCLSNVCTHRGKILVEEPVKADLIRCGYHGRRFSLEGRFLSMPEFEGVEDFPCDSDNLRQVPFAEREGFAFASLDPVDTFEAFVEDVMATLAGGAFNADGLTLSAAREYQVNAHWALYCENYLEGFHIPYVHHALNAVVDYGSYKTEMFRYSSLQTGYDDAGNIAALYLFIFPNLMFNLYPWGISVNIVQPIAPDKTNVEYMTYVRDESLLEKGAGADLHTVEMEDEAVVESVQKGIRSRFYNHGRYSPTREQGTHHFHRLIAEFMG